MQSIFHRSRKAFFSAVTLFVSVAVFSYFGYVPTDGVIKFYLVGLVAIPVLFTLWLALFNSGESKIDEHSIEFSCDGINYSHMSSMETILWPNYNNFRISGIFNKKLTIYGKGNKISFDINLFNAKQQKGIIATLSKKR